MTQPHEPQGNQDELPVSRDSARRLANAIEALNQHRFVRAHNSLSRLMFYQFLRGLAFGLGTVVGASILVSILVGLLSQVEFIPVLGDWATQIIKEIDQPRTENGGSSR